MVVTLPPYDLSDRSTRELLKQVPNLREFLLDAIPTIATGFDYTRVEFIEREFVTEDWRGRESDLLFRIPWSDGTCEMSVLVCVLIEHQSRPDRRMSFRTLLYSVLYWDREWKAWEELKPPRPDFTLTPIIPIVFHTGDQPWTNVKSIADLFAGPEILKIFAPQWDVCMWDLAQRSPEALLKSTSYWLKTLAAIRAASEPFDEFAETLLQVIKELNDICESEPIRWHELHRFMAAWILKLRDASERSRVMELARKALQESKRQTELLDMTTIAESLVEEGRVEGRVEGVRETLTQILEDRFGELPGEISHWIANTNDVSLLRAGTRQAMRMESIHDWQHPEFDDAQ